MLISYPIIGDNLVQTVRYTFPEQSADKGLVWINQTQYFEDVPPQIWNFRLGGDQICQKWLQERIGCSLSNNEIQQYQRLVLILKEIIELMIAIEAAIHHSQFNNHKIFENLQIIIAEQLGIEPKQISLASKFIDNLGADSLDMIEMFIVLEKAFNIQINHEVAQDISTVQKLVNYICQNLAY